MTPSQRKALQSLSDEPRALSELLDDSWKYKTMKESLRNLKALGLARRDDYPNESPGRRHLWSITEQGKQALETGSLKPKEKEPPINNDRINYGRVSSVFDLGRL